MNKYIMVLFIVTSLLFTGCATPGYQSRQAEYNNMGIGAVLGAVLGGVIGNNVGDGENQVLGAAIGAASGAWAGQQTGQAQDRTRQRIDNLERQATSQTIMVSNSNGSYTPVNIVNIGNGQYRGPRGEIYNGMPTESQLKSVYGF